MFVTSSICWFHLVLLICKDTWSMSQVTYWSECTWCLFRCCCRNILQEWGIERGHRRRGRWEERGRVEDWRWWGINNDPQQSFSSSCRIQDRGCGLVWANCPNGLPNPWIQQETESNSACLSKQAMVFPRLSLYTPFASIRAVQKQLSIVIYICSTI